MLSANAVREEMAALRDRLRLVGERQEWAKARRRREEERAAEKERRAAEREAEKEERRAEAAEAKARVRNAGPGDVDGDEEKKWDEEKSGRRAASGGDSDAEEDAAGEEEDDWSSGAEDGEEDRGGDSDSGSTSDSGEDGSSSGDSGVIRDDGGELARFLAEGDGDDAAESLSGSGDASNPDDELPPELKRVLGVGSRKGPDSKRGADSRRRAAPAREPAPKKKPKKRMGQRARRLLAEQMYGADANHVKMERLERERVERQAREQEANMHPAWAAKRAARAALAAAPVGKKVSFGEDGAASAAEHVGPKRTVPPPPTTRETKPKAMTGGYEASRSSANAVDRRAPSIGRVGRGGGRGGGGGGGGGRGGTPRGSEGGARAKKAKPVAKPPRAYVGEIKGGTGEVVGRVTKPMGPPSGEKKATPAGEKAGFALGGKRRFDADDAAAAHPAWAAKRRAAAEAWGSVKPAGKKITFD